MSNSSSFVKADKNKNDPLPEMSKLAFDCEKLQDLVDDLAEAIEDIFEDRDDPNETTNGMESRLQAMTRNNQMRIHRLHRYLERHSKQATVANNSEIMALVRELVTIVNNYMAMLIRNIQKLKHLLQENQLTDNNHYGTGSSESNQNYKKDGSSSFKTVYIPQQPNSRSVAKQIDVISEQMDVDAMLMELSDTEMYREELERDIVSVLVCWRDFRELIAAQDSMADAIEKNIAIAAANSVVTGLRDLNTVKH